MARYRKKPIVVEAIQWGPGLLVGGMCYCAAAGTDWAGGPYVATRPHLHTMHNGEIAILQPGDWIITEPDGIHHYLCKPDTFEATYELVESSDD